MTPCSGNSAVARWPVDGHVHFHGRFDPTRFLEGARRSFREAGRRSQSEPEAGGWLLFTNARGDAGLGSLERSLRAGGAPPWRAEETGEGGSLLARHPSGAGVVLLCGLQIVTAERLEVLALCCSEELPDGRPLSETLAAVRERGGFPVLPWGFGKWSGRRGEVVRRELERAEAGALAAGDNGGRWRRAPLPPLLRRAREHGFPLLPGSDPLPLAGQESRAGSYGFLIELQPSASAPLERMRKALASLRQSPPRFGSRRGALGFARDQIAMQLRKRLRPRP